MSIHNISIISNNEVSYISSYIFTPKYDYKYKIMGMIPELGY